MAARTCGQRERVHIQTVEADGAVRNRVKPGEQVAKGGLARTGLAHDAQQTRADIEVDGLERRVLLAGIGEGEVTDADVAFDAGVRVPEAPGRGGSGSSSSMFLIRSRDVIPALEQIGDPAQSHHGPGHQIQVVDEGYEIPRGDGPCNGHAASEENHQQQVTLLMKTEMGKSVPWTIATRRLS